MKGKHLISTQLTAYTPESKLTNNRGDDKPAPVGLKPGETPIVH